MTWLPYLDSGTPESLDATAETNDLLLQLLNQYIDINEGILRQLQLLNERFEEAFDTGITLDDIDLLEDE